MCLVSQSIWFVCMSSKEKLDLKKSKLDFSFINQTYIGLLSDIKHTIYEIYSVIEIPSLQ